MKSGKFFVVNPQHNEILVKAKKVSLIGVSELWGYTVCYEIQWNKNLLFKIFSPVVSFIVLIPYIEVFPVLEDYR